MYKRLSYGGLSISCPSVVNEASQKLVIMKMIMVTVLALAAVAAAAPAEPAEPAEPVKILKSEFDQQPEGSYVFNFETEDGIVRDEKGELKEVVDEENKPHSVVVVRGSYSYPGEDGKPVVVQYYADETGYHAEGDVVPKAPARK